MGLGNILLKDEGFGVHFIRWLEERWAFPADVAVIEGGVMAFSLLGPICACEHLIIIDVLKTADEPGALYRFTWEELEAKLPPPSSAHEVQLMDILQQAEILDECPEVVFLCVVPAEITEMDLELSPSLRERFPAMEELLMNELARQGIFPQSHA